ncbi:MAG: histidine kinase [Acetobacteraceae bacterium SCN 69-10]|nr:GAF domain-containing protein [Rhodospirillales bacterium]ODU57769.1 MAG: histidine kinase [Acetobacteraceae bacterium SCN 69-10]OJY65028.1 MAG: GAF domain-containing protein [Rhodospirillales bacterium 70-18]
MTRPDPTAHLAAVLAAHRDIDQPGATFRAVDAALAATIGHKLFTILIHHPGLKQSERFYSNLPDAYPVGGRKPVTDSPWMQRVIFGGEPYIGRTREDIKEVFFDYELIWSLGCESVLNMPVRWRGQTIGTLNLLHQAGWYSEDDIATTRLFAHLALPAMALISRS